jgi:hypothetical protein
MFPPLVHTLDLLQTLGSRLEGESLHDPRIVLAPLLELLQSQLVVLNTSRKAYLSLRWLASLQQNVSKLVPPFYLFF